MIISEVYFFRRLAEIINNERYKRRRFKAGRKKVKKGGRIKKGSGGQKTPSAGECRGADAG